ncbi:MAG TPA: M48 family metalloprotease [Acidobacteriota bacterium]|nr:M48 family metalloprotease [Acidobacteriota bacterium]
MRRSIVWRTAAVVVAATLVIWSMSCAKNPVTGKRELMLISTADEIALGKQLDPEILQTYGKYNNPELDAYVAALGHKLGALSHRPDLTYTVQVVDSDVVNAFALPGGYVYLTRGMLSYLNDEAELAGVMSHEIGHIAARHSVRQYSQAQLAMLGLGVGSMFSETFQKYAGIAQLGLSMLFLKFSRDDERQADALGVEYASRAGFDANHMANMFVTLERLNPGSDRSGLPGWFSTHPNPPDRIVAIQRDAQLWRDKLAGTAFVTNRDGYLSRLDGLIFGEDPRQGYVEGQTFYHPQLAFQFPVPSGWKVNNTAAQVQLYAAQQDAVILFSMAAGASPAAAAETFRQESQANVLQSESARINGLPAQRLVSDIALEQGNIRVASSFIQKDKYIYVFHSYTDPSLFDRYFSVFKQTMAGFNNLTDPAKLNVKPSQLTLRKTAAAGTARQAFQQLGVAADKLEAAAILNGVQLDAPLPAGTLLKLVTK